MKNIYLIGAGGHAKACIDVIECQGVYKIKGLFDISEKTGTKVGEYEVIGSDQQIAAYVSPENFFLICIGQIKSTEARLKMAAHLASLGAELATVISPRAFVAKTAHVGQGSIVMHDALVNAYAHVGRHCIINTKSLVEHDAVVEEFCHISTGAVVNGGTKVQKECFVGSNAVLKDNVILPAKSVVQAGSFYAGR